ncbi:MAG: Crotonobetainyl-CoA:carnitine CoA-transferase CaiB [Chloroflexi bacterium]|jgi:benzylsuccinate CoA-transferase BbsF subunit|nr:MAG: Crotonobetainyl-CoA:carnitine CoA-transferase CaiB [Chloroflexota bacterium]
MPDAATAHIDDSFPNGAFPDGPLSDVTILDLSDEATVQGARMLAELGADVVRVEDSAGDAVRSRPPYLAGPAGRPPGDEDGDVERSLAHLLFNGGKRSLALDLERRASWGVIARLLPAVDVVIGPLNVPQAGRSFFDDLRAAGAAGPAFVETIFRRGGPDGIATDHVATDLIAMAAGGHITLNGQTGEPPHYPAGQLAYRQASMTAAEAAIALLRAARIGHPGGHVVVSLQEAVNLTTLQTANANYWHWRGEVPSRHRAISSGAAYRSRDGKWTSFTVHPPNWFKFTDWVEQTIGDTTLRGPQWENMQYRADHTKDAVGIVERLCAAIDQADLCREGQARGLLVMPVNDVPDLAVNEHLNARHFFHDIEDPIVDATLRLPRTPFLSDRWQSPTRRAPALGEHTSEALAGLGGLSVAEIEALFEDGIASGMHPPEDASLPKQRSRVASPTAGANADPRQPLAGVRVVDFTWAIAGTLCTRLLADLGADVIKLESDYRTDPIRYIGVQPSDEMSYDTNGQFNDVNANKRAVTLNLNSPQGMAAARDLLATADVVTSNYTPDRLDKWGIGYEGLSAIKPDVILANMAVMGTFGPHKDWRSYGNGIVAMSGLAALTGLPDTQPLGLGTLHTDFTVPYYGAALIISALLQRDRTGHGQSLELSQFESALHLLDTELVEYLNNGVAPQRLGNRSRRFAPHGLFPGAATDTWVAVVCRDDADWARLLQVIDRPDLAAVSDRWAQEDRIEEALAAWTAGRDHWTAAAVLQAAGVPASPVETLEDLLTRDAAMRADYRELDLEIGVTAMVQEEPILWNGERLRLHRAPKWGEHTIEVLQGELGFSDERIAELAADNALW